MAGGGLHDHRLLSGKAAAQAVRHADEDGVANPVHDRQGGLVEDREGGAAPGPGADAVAREDAQMLGHRLGVVQMRLGHAVAGHQAIDRALVQAGVLQRLASRVDAQAGGADVGHLAHLRIGGADDGDLAAQRSQPRPSCIIFVNQPRMETPDGNRPPIQEAADMSLGPCQSKAHQRFTRGDDGAGCVADEQV